MHSPKNAHQTENVQSVSKPLFYQDIFRGQWKKRGIREEERIKH
ncbi:unnamed protein product, partial [Staurois parvus]